MLDFLDEINFCEKMENRTSNSIVKSKVDIIVEKELKKELFRDFEKNEEKKESSKKRGNKKDDFDYSYYINKELKRMDVSKLDTRKKKVLIQKIRNRMSA